MYDYTPDRTRAGPQNWLQNFRGHLQADAYGGYDGIYVKGQVIEVACWAHTRRHFFDAKDTDGRRAAQMLDMVRQLYAVEDQATARVVELEDITIDQADAIRRELRQAQSVPILARIRGWLDSELKLVLPRSPMAGAIGYTLNQWDALNRYVEQGFLNIGRVEGWRGDDRTGELLFAGGFSPYAGASIRSVAPFPHPARRTGHAALLHPALIQVLRPSHPAWLHGSRAA